MSGDSGEINLPFDLSIGYQIQLTHRLMQKLLQLKIEQFGVTLGMWYFLRVLWDQDGLTQKELSDLVGTMEPTTLSAIASMEQRGIVARVRNAADKRKINIFLTPYGHELKRKLLPIGIEVGDIAKTGISRREADLQIALLGELQTNLEAAIRSLSPRSPTRSRVGGAERTEGSPASLMRQATDAIVGVLATMDAPHQCCAPILTSLMVR